MGMLAPLKEDDIELGLSLSVGRRSYKEEAPLENCRSRLNDVEPGFEPVVLGRLAAESTQVEINVRTKKEMQALRRREAKRKREEKRLVRNGGALSNGDVEHSLKKKLPRGAGLMTAKTVNLNLSVDQNDGGNVIIPPVAGYITGAGWGSVRDGQDSEKEGSKGKDGSPAATSPTCSDHRTSASREGGNSSDIKSHISQSGPDQPPSNGSKASDAKSDCECSATSVQDLHASTNGVADLSEIKKVASNACLSSPNGSITETRNHVSSSTDPAPGRTVQGNGEMERPPKPKPQSNAASVLSTMPCVSTTGNGPNGKTVNGFLYRYATSKEVSIICVCHGTSFSPAEFVQHAGGTDMSNPLRHITMVASAI